MSPQVFRAKPNPIGKDRIGNLVPQQQLAGEWVDILNPSNTGQDLTKIQLYHWAYTTPKAKWELVMDFTGCGTLPAGKVMRVHSSGVMPVEQLLPVDRQGADYHLFSGSGYVWNNDKYDFPMLWNSTTERELDRTTYSANPMEGKILNRVGDTLI